MYAQARAFASARLRTYSTIVVTLAVSTWIRLRMWSEATYARIHESFYTATYSRRGGRRLVYATVSDKRVSILASPAALPLCDKNAIDVTGALAYLIAAHNGKPSIGITYRHISATSGVAPVTLILYICDVSHGLSRAVIDMDGDCELLSQTDLSFIDISAVPLTRVIGL